MITPILKLYTIIFGISGASGILYENGSLLLISDDSRVLYNYSIDDKQLSKINLNPEDPINAHIEKKLKPDFESITKSGNQYYIFGSGSSENRFQMRKVSLDFQQIEIVSLKELYLRMMNSSEISEDDFNLEGVVLVEETAYFFNRGNGPNQKNGIIKVENWQNPTESKIQYQNIQLPQIKNVAFSFTDAILVDDYFYITASAEDTSSTYDDGEVLGSGIGKISLTDFQLKDFRIITEEFKIEGLSVFEKQHDKIRFLLCEDADNGLAETNIFYFEWKK